MTTDRDSAIDAAVEQLRRGEVIAFPTETVYGFAVDARDEAAVQRLYERKGRPAVKPLSVLVGGESVARRLVRHWPARASELVARYWPGPLTIVLPRVLTGPDAVPEITVAGGDTIGLRCPDHPVALSLLAAFDGPLGAPSANRSGEDPPTDAPTVAANFPDMLVLDGGPCRLATPSTVVAISEGGEVTVLREGAVAADALVSG